MFFLINILFLIQLSSQTSSSSSIFFSLEQVYHLSTLFTTPHPPNSSPTNPEFPVTTELIT